ncbi:hypothetical protein [Stenotrophomonas maltophilia]|uniref:hypothetical protein n=1 Tax=Stenotrophomonas maltophilia TaxID=40324 RepID=UPI00143256CA|nr:hypothetical protein [Stenotrophomonas maltophilia]
MNPNERTNWCIQQAEGIEAGLPPVDADLDLIPIGYAIAGWCRGMATILATEGERAA